MVKQSPVFIHGATCRIRVRSSGEIELLWPHDFDWHIGRYEEYSEAGSVSGTIYLKGIVYRMPPSPQAASGLNLDINISRHCHNIRWFILQSALLRICPVKGKSLTRQSDPLLRSRFSPEQSCQTRRRICLSYQQQRRKKIDTHIYTTEIKPPHSCSSGVGHYPKLLTRLCSLESIGLTNERLRAGRWSGHSWRNCE